MAKQAKKEKSIKQIKTRPEKKIKWGKISWYVFLVIILILFIVNNTRKDDSERFEYPPTVPKNLYSEFPLAYDFQLKSIDGRSVKLSDYRGKVVLVDFWATWCKPCQKSIPDLIEIQKQFSEVQVLGITLDENPLKVVPPFVKDYKINYPILIGDDKVNEEFGGINAIPTLFLIDKQGRIINKYVGLVNKDILIKEINRIKGLG